MSEQLEQAAGVQPERRRNQGLRDAFDEVFVMMEPFFDPEQGWAGQSLEHLAYRMVRASFPALSAEEVQSLVVVAHRVYIERHPDSSSHLQRPGDLRPRSA